MNLWEACIYLKKLLKYPIIPIPLLKTRISEQTSLLNYKEFKPISYRDLSTCELLFNLLMNIPGLQILNSGHSCSHIYLDHRRQLGYFQNDATRNSADHKVREQNKHNPECPLGQAQNVPQQFQTPEGSPQVSAGCSWPKRDLYLHKAFCMYITYTHMNTLVSKEVIGPKLKTLK